MARAVTRYVCQSCAAEYARWQGQCDACGAWNSIVAESPDSPAGAAIGKLRGREIELESLAGQSGEISRLVTGVAEFDRVIGGGLVPGSAILVGGDPGIGKSTLQLQVASAVSGSHECVYVSGEESIDQVRMRAARLGLGSAPVHLAASTNIGDIAATVDRKPPRLMIVDSIQTMHLDTLDSAPGTVSQLRSASEVLIRLAKRRGITLVLVGHVTKEGTIAGPRILEHMVDTVLYFEGDRGHQFRILRAIKNRFGATDEIGVFEMTGGGLCPVDNPSALFLAQRRDGVAGTAVYAGIEGTRPILVEIQALVGSTASGVPRRAVIGWDSGRLAMVLAVLEARCGVNFAGRDVYLNVAGGLRVSEPAADLAVAAALVSSMYDRPLAAETVVFGEIGLSGEVRSVNRSDLRVREAIKLGFRSIWAPVLQAPDRNPDMTSSAHVVQLRVLRDLMGLLATPHEAAHPVETASA